MCPVRTELSGNTLGIGEVTTGDQDVVAGLRQEFHDGPS